MLRTRGAPLTGLVGLADRRLQRAPALFSNAEARPCCPRAVDAAVAAVWREESLPPWPDRETPDTCVGAEPTGADRHRLRPWVTPIRAL
ncbi:hypothetical protein HPB50_004700 [Hyalomma asiaticum]|uniref:Uncharacterized protein n=1 Tax=Hyalomma asiaticum TaxID=266040 RepID=A0ACB7STD4_HYAAI|nr:hypothetical protein HPB50_004700 [Hyalomma asiaticum]